MKQKVCGYRELEIKRWLLEDNAELRQRRYGVPGHVMAHDLDAAGVRQEQPREKLEGRRLAGRVGAQEGDELTRVGGETDAVDGADRPVGLDHLIEEKGRAAFVHRHPLVIVMGPSCRCATWRLACSIAL